jgi:hypothetical protein
VQGKTGIAGSEYVINQDQYDKDGIDGHTKEDKAVREF